MGRDQPVYRSYLLRLWSTTVDREMVWRASLESSRTGERHRFASVDGLCDFLRRQTGASSDETRVRSDEDGESAP